eukprot:TRINITY_DN4505_c0_g1_i1.p1 TRINITY_DN4505_c0_g1~~TRINITY_DN4505_c0_g1_i1.p1  ORF type:complete len:202 (+),score=21.83 TRINITY_DN4505_c0_g1_i1:289-894(+)
MLHNMNTTAQIPAIPAVLLSDTIETFSETADIPKVVGIKLHSIFTTSDHVWIVFRNFKGFNVRLYFYANCVHVIFSVTPYTAQAIIEEFKPISDSDQEQILKKMAEADQQDLVVRQTTPWNPVEQEQQIYLPNDFKRAFNGSSQPSFREQGYIVKTPCPIIYNKNYIKKAIRNQFILYQIPKAEDEDRRRDKTKSSHSGGL